MRHGIQQKATNGAGHAEAANYLRRFMATATEHHGWMCSSGPRLSSVDWRQLCSAPWAESYFDDAATTVVDNDPVSTTYAAEKSIGAVPSIGMALAGSVQIGRHAATTFIAHALLLARLVLPSTMIRGVAPSTPSLEGCAGVI